MKRNLVHATLWCLLVVYASSAQMQWTKTNWPTSTNFFDLYASQNKVFARTWDSLNGGRTFFTSDNGANWTQISSADSSIDILSIVLLNNNVLAGTCKNFYRSAVSAISWNAVTPTTIADTAIWSIAMLATTLYAGTTGDIYKSSDSGNTWTEIKSGIPASARIRSIVASGSAVFAGSDTSGVFSTTNGGTSWTASNSGLTDKHIFQLAVMGSKIFAVTLNGVFVSGNSGTSWTANSSLKNSNCFVAVQNQLFAGTDSSGVYLSSDSGVTWTASGPGMPAGTRVWSLTATSDNLFAATSSGVWRYPLSIIPIRFPLISPSTCSGLRIWRHNGSQAAIAFALQGPETVDLAVYDLCGDKILSLAHERMGAGMQNLIFTTGSIAPGSYIIRLTTGLAVHQQTVAMLR